MYVFIKDFFLKNQVTFSVPTKIIFFLPILFSFPFWSFDSFILLRVEPMSLLPAKHTLNYIL